MAERINDIIRSRSSLPPFSDNEEFSDEEEEEDLQHLSVSSLSRQGSRQRVSSNNFKHLKKLPANYRRSSSLTEKVATNKKGPNEDDDVMSDNNDSDDGSHDLEDTPNEENNTLQLFDDNDDDNVSNSSKGIAKAPVSKSNKPSIPSRGTYVTC